MCVANKSEIQDTTLYTKRQLGDLTKGQFWQMIAEDDGETRQQQEHRRPANLVSLTRLVRVDVVVLVRVVRHGQPYRPTVVLPSAGCLAGIAVGAGMATIGKLPLMAVSSVPLPTTDTPVREGIGASMQGNRCSRE